MRIYYDTEFTSLDGNVNWELISAGFVSEDGREWYAEITDFPHENCSEFVQENALPLLGQGGVVPERMPGDEFAERLCAWLRQFGEPIELISDAACDWNLVNGYCYTYFREMPHKIEGHIWYPSEREITKKRLAEAEREFWYQNRGIQHHALIDARRLRLIARKQLAMMGLLNTKSESEAEEAMQAERAEILRRGEKW